MNPKLTPLIVGAALVLGAPHDAQAPLTKHGPGAGPVGPVHRSIGSENVRLGFAVDDTYGLVLSYLGDGKERRAVTFEPRSLWRLRLLDQNGSSVDDDVVEVDAADCTFDVVVAKGERSFRAFWRNVEISHPDLPASSRAEVMLYGRLAEDGRSFEFDLEVETDVPGFSLYAVAFDAAIRERGSSADQVFSVPRAGGTLMPGPLDSISFVQAALQQDEFGLGEHPALLSMQWLSYYDSADPDAAVAYFATRDDLGYAKLFRANALTGSSPRALELRVWTHPTDNAVATSFRSPYPYVLAVLRGDWYDAARYYREWAMQQPWSQSGALLDNPAAPQLLVDAKMYGVWTVPICMPPSVTPGVTGCLNVPDYTGVPYWTESVEELETFFGVDEVVGTVTTFWDNNSHFNANWGEWLPVTPEMLAEAPVMASAGNRFALYYAANNYSTIGPGYDVPNPGDPNTVPAFSTQPVSSFMQTDPFGGIPVSGQTLGSCNKNLGCGTAQDPFTITTARICTQTEFHDQLALHIMEEAVLSTSAVGFYLDNFTNGSSELCYETGHGHLAGDGLGWNLARFDLCRRLLAYFRGQSQENGQFFSAPNPDFYLTSEGEQEMYIGLIDLTRRTRSGDAADLFPGVPFRRHAPLFQTVYHGYQLAFDGRLAISGPIDPGVHANPIAMRTVRQQWAANVYFGHLPTATLILSETGVGGSIADKVALFEHYRLVMEMAQNIMVVHREPETRRFLVYGERLRDPVVTGVDTVAVETSGSGANFPAFWPGVDPEQPLVYVCAHRDGDEVGVAFINWSVAEDDTTTLPNLDVTDSPGDQTLTYTIDPVEYGMTPGMYEMVEVLGDGNPMAVLGTVDFTGTAPQAFPITVPGKSMRFVIFRPM